jgi:hypothetical protein
LRYETVDLEGDRMVYEYGARTPQLDIDARSAVIHVTYYDNENNFCGGQSLADYEKGVWKLVENT